MGGDIQGKHYCIFYFYKCIYMLLHFKYWHNLKLHGTICTMYTIIYITIPLLLRQFKISLFFIPLILEMHTLTPYSIVT